MLRRIEGWVVDKFYGGRVVKDVVMCCLQADLLEDLMEYMETKSNRFMRSLDGLQEGEHSIEGSTIHAEYVKLIERRLSEPLEKHRKSVEEFYEICGRIQEAGHAEEIKPFLHVVLAASDYLIFADIMRHPEKRAYFFQILRGLQSQFRAKMERMGDDGGFEESSKSSKEPDLSAGEGKSSSESSKSSSGTRSTRK